MISFGETVGDVKAEALRNTLQNSLAEVATGQWCDADRNASKE